MDRVSLYAAEEQEVYLELYKSILPTDGSFELLGFSTEYNIDTLRHSLSKLRPEVLLLGTKKFDKGKTEELETIRKESPGIGIVLLLVSYDVEDIQYLRRLTLAGKGGIAVFLKQSLDRVQQLRQLIVAVGQGQVILDPSLTNIILAEKVVHPFLQQLTARELEVLCLLSQGYSNSAIADSLYIDIRTVEKHINNMYYKLRGMADLIHMHPRVSAARLYLEITGELSAASCATPVNSGQGF